MRKKITNALISVYHKDRLDEIVGLLNGLGVKIFSTGGTYEYIDKLHGNAATVESLTSYPAILGGRVKTLHPKIFGGILYRRNDKNDLMQVEEYDIPPIDLVIVDLYPFQETLMATNDEDEIIEKIDVGGISLIRAAAKNYNDVLIVASSAMYDDLIRLLEEKKGYTDLDDRKRFATHAFHISSHYDTAIFHYFNSEKGDEKVLKFSFANPHSLRYGENPHQSGIFYGKLEDVFEQLHGKEISYNNLGDLEAGIGLISEFNETTFAILKHNNACGCASRPRLLDAWRDALAGDPVSAYGGVLVTNTEIDDDTAAEIDKLFFEIILAPGFKKNGLELLKAKKNRILLRSRSFDFPRYQFKSILNGVIWQDRDLKTEGPADLRTVTTKTPSDPEITDLIFANKLVKHSRSNSIVLAKNKQLLASGVGQTSRVDALKQAIVKAGEFKFDLQGAVMASDAFFPFADCVEIAHAAGITAVIEPGGSIRDKDSIEFCNTHEVSMVFSGTRHFKH